LKRLLGELSAQGAIEKRGKSLAKPGALPAVALVDIIGRDSDGELIATPVEWNEDEFGAAPRILIQAPRRARPGQPLPGVGDRALARTERTMTPVQRPEISGPRHKAAGARATSHDRRVADRGNGVGRLEPIEKKQAGRDLVVMKEDQGEAKDGDLVSVDLVGKTRLGAARARVREILAQ